MTTLRRLTQRFWRKTPISPDALRTIYAGELLRGKTALITGAGQNIGRAVALEMAQQGANIAFIERDVERGQALERELLAYPVHTQAIYADLADDPLDLPETPIDVLVLNAALQIEATFFEATDTDWQRSASANLEAPMRLTRRVAARMKQRQSGSVIFITSSHTDLPSRWPVYSAAKAAQAAVMRELAVELAAYSVRVNAVAPGWTQEEAEISRLALLHNRTIEPAYIGRAVVYLASDFFSRYTTGTTLKIDAGMSLYSGRVPFDLPGD
jgi:NAD(P)-dependent dehydrogenase (short-subunit alcohol dehydrogenase family)